MIVPGGSRDLLAEFWRESVLRISSNQCPPHSVFKKLEACRRMNASFRGILACAVLSLIAAGCVQGAAAQATTSASTKHPVKASHPSNAQLADPKIEARVDRLLRQMTLEEEIGQLVQYNDAGYSSAAPACEP